MQQVFSKIKLFIFIQIIFIGCSHEPAPIIVLEPISDNTSWLHGQEFINLIEDNVEVSIAFYRTIDDIYIFDAEIKNISKNSILISPENAYCYSRKEGMNSTTIKVFAKDPENELTQIDNLIEKENNGYSNDVTVDGIFSILDFAVSIATIGDDKTDEEIQEKIELDETTENSRISRDENHEAKITNLTQRRDEWEISTLRKTTLDKNSFVQGRIYFPAAIVSKSINIIFPIENSLFEFQFLTILK